MQEVNTDRYVDHMIDQQKLKRNPESRHLQSWKGKTYNNSQVKIILDSEDVELQIQESISMAWGESVAEFLSTTTNDRGVPVYTDTID